MIHWLNKLALMLLFILPVMPAFGADAPLRIEGAPAGWPWHGTSMSLTHATPADIERFHQKLGINVIRLQITARKYAEMHTVSADEALLAGMRWADTMLDTCAKLGITAVINVSQFPFDPSKPDQTTPGFWSRQESPEDVLQAVRTITTHFQRRGPELAAYDFMSEPVLVLTKGKSRISPPLWPGLLGKIIAEVRKVDQRRWIVVATGPWGGVEGYEHFDPPSDKKLIWGAHIYAPNAFTHQGLNDKQARDLAYPGEIGRKHWDKAALKSALEPLRSFSASHPGPVWIGEFSAVRWAKGGETYIKDLVSIFDEFGWGWAYFSATGWHGWNPDYNSDYGNNDALKQQLIGERSQRWQTLHSIFTKGNNRAPK